MALTAQHRELLKLFFLKNVSNDSQGLDWLIDFMLQTKAQQKAIIIAWLEDRKSQNATSISQLEVHKETAQTVLTNENTLITDLEGQL